MSVTALRTGSAPDLLFLAPCLPYPPDRGDRLRWHHMLKFLSRSYRVHLGCVADPRCPPGQLARLRALCYESCFVAPPSLGQRLRALAPGQPCADASAPSLLDWAVRMAQRFPLQGAVACSARTAGMLAHLPGEMVRIADYVDVESAKLEQRSAGRGWPAARLGQRAAARQLALERGAAHGIDHLLFASHHAAAAFRARAPEHAGLVRTVGNGVDADYFSPHIVHRNPYPPGCRALVFAGAMDDWANAEAADWFARRVFAALRASDPALHFYVVGARPCARVRALAHRSGVVVTGAVPDLRPWLAHAALALAPLQHAHGIQNKVLEAMAMQQVVVATPEALAGVPAAVGAEVLQACDAAEFAAAIRSVPGSATARAIARAARARVLRDCSWQANLARLPELLAVPAPRHASGG
jgi:sugar transferase (PEP-CTERM/EpsH1 system associated)